MGVPGIFAHIVKKYRNIKGNPIIFKKIDSHIVIEELFFDANGIFHPKSQEIAREYNHLIGTNPNLLESKMIKNIINYIEDIINYIKPTKVIYIAIDGVAPMGKIKHQRLRRFKSIRDQQIITSIAKKHNKEIPKHWNSNCITPGTLFMKKIFIAIHNFIKKRKEEGCNLTYYFSTSNSPGEGEHKIIDYIHNHKEKDSTVFCIHGLDADLIFLSLATNVKNLYLLREQQDPVTGNPINNQFNLVSIQNYKNLLVRDMTDNTSNIINQDDKNRYIRDYIFLCFLLGNDFIPNIPSTNLKNLKYEFNGQEIILKNYKLIAEDYKQDHNDENPKFLISDDYKIDKLFFTTLLKYLADEEEEYFVKLNKSKEKSYGSKCLSSDPYDLEIHRLNNLYFKINDPIDITNNFEQGKRRFYIHYFGDIDLDLLCYDYIKTLYWILHYYYDKTSIGSQCQLPDWLWYYKWHQGPFASDLYNYIIKLSDVEWDRLSKIFPSKPSNYGVITPFTQLLMVLPKQSNFLLPREYRKIQENMELEKYFPKIFEQDLLFKTKFWQAVPDIKIIDHNVVVKYIKNINLTKDEQYRNKQFRMIKY